MSKQPKEHQDESADPRPPRPWWKTALRWMGELILYFLIAVILVSAMRFFLVQNYVVPSGSMENTIMTQDMILAWKPGEVQRGDIVVFRDDLGWLTPYADDAPAWKQALAWLKILPPQDEQYLVKRLIGMPGDHVECCDNQGRFMVNGVALDETTLLYSDLNRALRPFSVVVPQGHFLAMGDHRDSSKDSRAMLCDTHSLEIATPDLEAIQGRVFAVLRPLSRAQTFKTPETYSSVPPPSREAPTIESAVWDCPKNR